MENPWVKIGLIEANCQNLETVTTCLNYCYKLKVGAPSKYGSYVWEPIMAVLINIFKKKKLKNVNDIIFFIEDVNDIYKSLDFEKVRLEVYGNQQNLDVEAEFLKDYVRYYTEEDI